MQGGSILFFLLKRFILFGCEQFISPPPAFSFFNFLIMFSIIMMLSLSLYVYLSQKWSRKRLLNHSENSWSRSISS